MSAVVRSPAMAGRFYPDDPAACAATVDGYLADVRLVAGAPPKALVAPHAGFIYSGAVAATAYARLALEPRPGLMSFTTRPWPGTPKLMNSSLPSVSVVAPK